MKRLRRWLFNLAAAVFLMLCMGTVALWIRGYWRVDNVLYHFSRSGMVYGKVMFISAKGSCIIGHDVTVETKQISPSEVWSGPQIFSFEVTPTVDPFFDFRRSGWCVAGFGYVRETYSH